VRRFDPGLLQKGNNWMEPKPPDPAINSAGFDLFPFFSPRGQTLYFVRDFSAFYRTSLKEALDSAK